MFGLNEKKTFDKTTGDFLYIHKIFKTIQGEGVFAGQPAIFIRLSGCNLSCSFCDTNFEDYNKKTIDEILKLVIELSNGIIKLIVITGGEPLRQNLKKLCDELHLANLKIQIETNGIFYQAINEKVYVCCSPKVVNNQYIKPHELWKNKIFFLKFLISASGINETEKTTLKTSNTFTNAIKNKEIELLCRSKTQIPLQYSSIPAWAKDYSDNITIQPMDEYDAEKNALNLALCYELSTEFGYNISLQLHKIMNIE